MFDKFNDDSIKAIVQAQAHAARLGSDRVNVAHLLLALIGEEGGEVCGILTEMGADSRSLRSRLEAHAVAANQDELRSDSVPADLPFTEKALNVLELAKKLSRNGDKKPIGPELLFISIIDLAENTELFAGSDLDLSVLRSRVIDASHKVALAREQRLGVRKVIDNANDEAAQQRFFETFLNELDGFFTHAKSVNDALFMVVNILGKVLHVNRCIIVCEASRLPTLVRQERWKCYEYHNREVKSCADLHWPTRESKLIAQILQINAPTLFEKQSQSVQDELRLLGAKSFVGVALRSQEITLGCLILQQCDMWRTWSEDEIDYIDRVADTVAHRLCAGWGLNS